MKTDWALIQSYKQKKKKKDDPLEKLESGSFPPIDSILK